MTLGAIAQLGERPAGSREVVGSSPTSSTSESPRGPAIADAASAFVNAGDAPTLAPNVQVKEESMRISARNQLRGRVTGISRGEAIANVQLEVAGQRLVASITVEAVEELGIAEGSDIVAVVKASDAMLAVE